MKLSKYMDLALLQTMIDGGYVDRKDSSCGHFYLLDYSRSAQFEKIWNFVTTKCRGLIVDSKTDDIVGMVPVKFFNLAEGVDGHVAAYKDCVDKNLKFIATEKMDGSFICTFHDKYQKRWRCATRGSFSSDQAKWSEEWLYKNSKPAALMVGSSYIFETIYPENRIVVDYGNTEELVLLTAYREYGEDWCELCRDEIILTAGMLNLRYVPEYPFQSIDDVVKTCETLDANHEGFVLQFENGFRVKVKGSEYCRIHKILNGLTTKSIWENIDLSTFTIRKDWLIAVPEEFLPEIESFGSELITKIKAEYEDVLAKTQDAILIAKRDFGVDYTKKQFAVDVLQKHFKKDFHNIMRIYLYNDHEGLKMAIWDLNKPEFKKMTTVGEE